MRLGKGNLVRELPATILWPSTEEKHRNSLGPLALCAYLNAFQQGPYRKQYKALTWSQMRQMPSAQGSFCFHKS